MEIPKVGDVVYGYQGISPLRSVLWCIHGLFGKDNESFAAAIDVVMGAKG